MVLAWQRSTHEMRTKFLSQNPRPLPDQLLDGRTILKSILMNSAKGVFRLDMPFNQIADWSF